MSRLIARILLAILTFPLAACVYTVSVVVLMRYVNRGSIGYSVRETTCFLLAGVLTSAFMASYWLLLWYQSIRWTARRRKTTVLVALGAILAGLVAGTVTSGVAASSSFGAFIGTIVAPLLWIVGTIFAWRETSAERTERLKGVSAENIACPTCGYNLTGLSELRCPECGDRFTINEILAAQPGREPTEMEG